LETHRKAAVLLASLDADTADALIDRMPPEMAHHARELLLSLEDIDPTEQKSVVDEFLRSGVSSPGAEPGGVEIEAGLARRLALAGPTYEVGRSTAEPVQAARAGDETEDDSQPLPNAPFSFLRDAQARDIALYLEREHPQTVAIVVAHLPPERAAEVMAALPAALLADVVRRLVDLRQTEPEIVRELESALEANLTQRRPGQHFGGAAGVSAVLQAAAPAAQRQILENLADHAPDLAAQLSPPVAMREMTFEDIFRLGDFALAQVLSDVEADLLTLALAGAAPSLVQRVLDQLPRREAKLLRQALQHLGPTRLSDVEQAQRELVAAALRHQQHSKAGRAPGLSLTI
jgi:flagellar motor switch protein FliG